MPYADPAAQRAARRRHYEKHRVEVRDAQLRYRATTRSILARMHYRHKMKEAEHG